MGEILCEDTERPYTRKGFAAPSDPFDLDRGEYKIRTEEINAQGVSKERFFAVGLAMWLSSFVFPTGEGNAIRAKTLALICQMTRGERVAVGVSWVAYFMNMMDCASMPEKNSPSSKTSSLPLHYWMGELSCYCLESDLSKRSVGNAKVPLLFSIIGSPPSRRDLKTAHDFFHRMPQNDEEP